MANAVAHDDHGSPEAIKSLIRKAMVVFGALVVLTCLTVWVSTVGVRGHWATGTVVTVALAVAVTKGTLVALYFMHLIDERKLIYYTLVLVAVLFIPLMALPNLTEGEHMNDRVQREAVMPGTESEGGTHEGAPQGEAATPTPATQEAAAQPGGPASPVTITVSFNGTAPARVKLHREADAFCAKTPMLSEDVLVKGGKLQNVLVHVVKGAEGQSFPAPASPVVLAQDNCMYRPRVQGVLAGSTVDIRFADPIQHNIHPYKGEESLWNVAHGPGDVTKTTADFGLEEGLVQLKCDIHPWMTGYLYISKNPYFAVTDANGMAKLELPAGSYTVEAWQEKLGIRSADLTVTGGSPATLRFDFGSS